MKRKFPLFFGIITIFFLAIYLNLDIEPEDTNIENYNVSSNELYNLYYLLKTQKLIDKHESYKDVVKLIDISNLLKKENQGILFDIWLYVNLFEEYGLSVREINKEQIIDFLSSLQNDNGMFNAFLSEGTYDENLYNYLLPTKLAVEVYELLNLKTPNRDKRQLWIDENIDEILKAKQKDFISSGGFLYLSKFLKNKEESTLNISLNNYMDIISKHYKSTPNSVEKFDTAMNIDSVFSTNTLLLEKDEVEKYLGNVQLENGSFSLYGKKEYPDAFTTFLSIGLLYMLDSKIPKIDELTVWLGNEINKTLVSINNWYKLL